MKHSHGFWFPDYDDHFPRMLRKSMITDGVSRYQWRARDAAIALCNQHRTCIDIGANVGLWSCDLVKSFHNVIAFEPVPEFVECFKKNVISNNYEMFTVALGRTQSLIDMNIVVGNTGHSHIDQTSFGKGNTLMLPLDHYNFTDIDMIKIDVEGFEGEILAGALNTIKANRPVLVIEQQKHEYQNDIESKPAIKTLQDWGYVVVESFNKDWILKYQGDHA